MATKDLVGVMEAAYRVELPEAAWLEGITTAAVPLLDRGFGMLAYVYDARGGTLPVIGHMHASPRFDPAWVQAFRSIRPRELTPQKDYTPIEWRTWIHMSCGTASTIPGLESVCEQLHTFGGARDVFAINGTDPTRFGVWLAIPLPHRTAVTPTSRKLYTRIASHLAAAYRIRRQLRDGERTVDTAEAVLAPDGKLLHATGAARTNDAREVLRQAALRIEKTRTKAGRADDDAATQAWQGVVMARWSLVDDSSSGRRALVATRNESAQDAAALSRRERQVLGFVALGRSDKDIAYDLGLTPATVRVIVHRAGKRLGCSTRADLMRRYHELRRPAAPR